MGTYDGGQAELLRVPFADFNCLVLPEDAKEREDDYVMLSDIFPTGWQHKAGGAATRRVHCHLRRRPGRLDGGALRAYPRRFAGLRNRRSTRPLETGCPDGATPINSVEQKAVDEILNYTDGKGTDRGCECVGYQCCDKHGHEVNHLTMNNLVASTKATGGIGVVGLFVPQDPGAKNS